MGKLIVDFVGHDYGVSANFLEKALPQAVPRSVYSVSRIECENNVKTAIEIPCKVNYHLMVILAANEENQKLAQLHVADGTLKLNQYHGALVVNIEGKTIEEIVIESFVWVRKFSSPSSQPIVAVVPSLWEEF